MASCKRARIAAVEAVISLLTIATSEVAIAPAQLARFSSAWKVSPMVLFPSAVAATWRWRGGIGGIGDIARWISARVGAHIRQRGAAAMRLSRFTDRQIVPDQRETVEDPPFGRIELRS